MSGVILSQGVPFFLLLLSLAILNGFANMLQCVTWCQSDFIILYSSEGFSISTWGNSNQQSFTLGFGLVKAD